MFRVIQVALDGSTRAEQALPIAAALAKRDGAALQVVRVYEPMTGVYRGGALNFVATLDQERMDDERDRLAEIAKSLTEETGLPTKHVLLEGPVPETLARHAAASGADLLIATTHGRGPLARIWFGSVADSLVRQSPIPILLVRPQETAPDFAQPPPVRRVLIPLDGSQLAEQALEPALSLGGAEKAEFTLLRVVPAILPAAYNPAGGRGGGTHVSWYELLHELKCELETEARDYLKRITERLQAESWKVNAHLVAHEQPATAILDAAASHGVNAIALTTRGHGGMKRLLSGSVADKVIRGATTPVLVCPSMTGPVSV